MSEDRRVMIDKEELKAILSDVVSEQHCWMNEDDRHDARELLKIYRETSSALRKAIIRGFLIIVFLAACFIAAVKSGFMEGHH